MDRMQAFRGPTESSGLPVSGKFNARAFLNRKDRYEKNSDPWAHPLVYPTPGRRQ